MAILRWIGRIFVLLIVAAVVTGFAARFTDGPLAMFPGGELVAGEMVAEPLADWSFVHALEEMAARSYRRRPRGSSD